MKKNFFKKLAFFMALAMVITAISPAAFANAAAAPKIDATSKTLYVKGTYDFGILNKVAKSTYKWTSSNTAIAKVDAKTGLTTAVAPGKATISCKITLPTKKTATVKAVVTVKQKATAVKVNNYTDGMTIKVGEKAFDFNITKTPAKATSATFWMINEATNTAGATVVSGGVVNTTKVGEFEIKAVCAESAAAFEAGNYTTETEWLKVKVAAFAESVRQTTTNQIELTFGTNVKDIVKAADISIKTKTGVVQVVKDDGVSFSDDGKKVTVTTYADYTDKVDYVVTYNGVDNGFIASIGAPVSITVTTNTVVVDSEDSLTYKVLDATGVDITSAIDSNNITIDVDTASNGYFNGSNKDPKLTMYVKGKTAAMTVTYHTYEYDANGNEKGTIVGKGTITAVDAATITATGVAAYTITDGSADWDNLVKTIPAEKTGYSIIAKINLSDDKTTTSTEDIVYSSSNNAVLLVDSNGSLYPIKAGSVQVIATVKGVKYTLSVTVTGASSAATIGTDDNSTTATISNTSEVSDSKTIEVVIKDQYASAMKLATGDVTIEPLSVPTSNEMTLPTAKDTDDDGKIEFTFDPQGKAAGTYKYKIVASGKTMTYTVVVLNVDATKADSYEVRLSTKNIDNAVAADAANIDDKMVTAKVAHLKGGVFYDYVSDATYTISGADTKDVEGNTTTSGGVLTFKTAAVTTTTSGAIIKTETGSYVVKAQFASTEKTAVFTVIDTQKKPTFVVEKTAVDATDILDIAKKALKVTSATGTADTTDATIKGVVAKRGGLTTKAGINNAGEVISETPSTNSKSVYIEKIYVEEKTTGTGGVTIIHEVTVNRTVTIN